LAAYCPALDSRVSLRVVMGQKELKVLKLTFFSSPIAQLGRCENRRSPTEACAKSACTALLVVFLSAALALLSRSY